jgi:LmbE family N-acetylglucosaminyl deacetylase
MPAKTVIAIGAHPDDIEFYMAGTLLLFKKAGFEIHYVNVASGNCGSTEYNAATTCSIRNTEARAAAKILGAHFHSNLTDDLEILYNLELLRAMTAVIREVKPSVILTHSPQDYMEDHTNTCRLAVTAAFARGIPNFKCSPPRPAGDYDTTVYHAMPHGLRDGLRRRIIPEAFVNTTSVQVTKRDALASHSSQQGWLDISQKFSSYLLAMEDMSLEMGRFSKRFKHAEGWRRHLHYGFCSEDADPMAKALGKTYFANKAYARSLEHGC